MTIPCPNCGRLNRPGSRYCASCQAPLGSAAGAPLQPGQLLDGGTYRVERPLGKGGMGAVWLVAQTKAFDRLAVLKEVVEYFDPGDAVERAKAAERFEAEARTLGDLKHPGIPDLYAYFSEGGHNYLVMEYIEGPDLRRGLTREDSDTGRLVPGGPFPSDQVVRYVIQICEVLEYLANRQPPVVHNDIKPGNIIVDEHSGRAVLVDFGTAKTRYLRAAGAPDGARASIYGTVGYAAPELYQGRSEPRSDVYSLAATAYHLLTDDDPRDHPMQYPLLQTLPSPLADILQAALAYEIGDRPAATELHQQLEGYLAGLTGPLRALTFPDGDTADERDDLVAQAVKHWDYTAGILQDGTIAHWLRNALHDPVAAQAAEAAVQQWPGNRDAALDAFVRQLSPAALPPGRLEVRTSSIRLPEVRPGQRVSEKIDIANPGQGYLQGEMLSTQPWLQVGSAFTCLPGKACSIPIQINAAGLPAGAYVAAVTLTPKGGLPEVVPVQISVRTEKAEPTQVSSPASAIEVSPRTVDFGRVDDRALATSTETVSVVNVGRSPVQVRVQGAPRWLLLKPETFRLGAGARQAVQLIGRLDRVTHRSEKVRLTFAIDGGQKGSSQEVDVRLQTKGRGLFR